MNILLVTAMFPPTRTGTSFYSRNLARALVERGHQVRVVTLATEAQADGEPEVSVEHLRAMRVPVPGFFKHFRVCSVVPTNFRAMARAARRFGAEVVLVVNHYLDIVFPAIYAARSCRIPLVCSVGTQLQSSKPLRHTVLRFLDRLICGRLVFPFCDRVVAWDGQILKYLGDVHGRAVTDKTVIVNYGVNGDPAVFLAHAHDYDLHDQILGVGAVSEQRSFVPLVSAFARLTHEFPALRLKIIGHVYYDEALQVASALGVAHRVDFAGEQSHAEVLAQMGRSDALYSSLTGRYLGLGTATIESMLMGLPTIANAPLDLLGGPILEDMTHLVHCPEPTPEAIAKKVGALLRDREQRARVGQGGRRFILEHMSWKKVARDMERALGETVGRRAC